MSPLAEPKYAVIAIVWLAYVLCLAGHGIIKLIEDDNSSAGGCFAMLLLVAITVTACAVAMM